MSKQKVILNIVSVAVFGIFLVLPILFFNKKDTTAQNENRLLAVFPELISNGKIDKNFLKNLNVYINDRFGFRQNLIEIDSNVKYKILGDSGNTKAVLGKNNWLYFISKSDGDNARDFAKQNLVSSEYANNFAEMIYTRQMWCESNGIKFIFLILPNKHSIYPENYSIDRPNGITRTEQIIRAMDALNVNYIYPQRELLDAKEQYNSPLYYETDTHWNQLGAFVAFKSLEKYVTLKYPDLQFADINYSFEVEKTLIRGDLVKMLGLKNYGLLTHIVFNPTDSDWVNFYKYLGIEEGSVVKTENINEKNPRAIIFRDSFFNSIIPFTSSIFSSVDYQFTKFENSDKEYILKNKPDIVIWEIVERYIPLIPNIPFED